MLVCVCAYVQLKSYKRKLVGHVIVTYLKSGIPLIFRLWLLLGLGSVVRYDVRPRMGKHQRRGNLLGKNVQFIDD